LPLCGDKAYGFWILGLGLGLAFMLSFSSKTMGGFLVALFLFFP
jgi:hypothetical protein